MIFLAGGILHEALMMSPAPEQTMKQGVEETRIQVAPYRHRLGYYTEHIKTKSIGLDISRSKGLLSFSSNIRYDREHIRNTRCHPGYLGPSHSLPA